MSAVHPEVVLAAGYAIFLFAIALGLELTANVSYRRSKRMRTLGFEYHRTSDRWRCPEGQHLTRYAVDHQFKIVRYRAPAHICNGCERKPDCTDSDHGREIVSAPDKWLQTEIGRFHRGMSLVLLVLAAAILAIEGIRYEYVPDLRLLGAALTLVMLGGGRLAVALLAKREGHPAS